MATSSTLDELQSSSSISSSYQEPQKKTTERNQSIFLSSSLFRKPWSTSSIFGTSVIDDSLIDTNESVIYTIDTSSSLENQINGDREEYLRKNITQKFLYLLKEEDFEFGFISRSEELIKEQLEINALATRNWLNEIFIKHFHNDVVLIGLLRILSRFDESIIFPQGQTIALTALSHRNDEIKELGIRAFEKWCSRDSLNILKNLDIRNTWLQEYVNDVINDLKEQLCLF